jgi:hypothetical protein
MAITDREQPTNYFSAHDDLWHMALSDNADSVDFKYIFDIYSDGKQLIRAKVFPDPSTKRGYFNVSNVIANEMKFDWFEPDGNFVMTELNDSGQIYKTYQCKYGEEVAGTATLNMASATTIVANCVPNLFSRRLGTGSSIFYNNGLKYKTNREKINKSDYGEDFYIGFVGYTDQAYQFKLKQYNSSRQLISTTVIAQPTVNNTGIFQLNISPDAINQGIPASGNIFSNSCAYYNVEVWNLEVEDQQFPDDLFTIYFDCNPKYDTINLHFMNSWGLFDTARFSYASRLTMDAERKTFEKPDYRFGNYVTYDNNYTLPNSDNNRLYFENKINYGSQYKWNYKLTMDFPSDQDYEWLSELIMSPQVYAEIRTETYEKQYYPVSIKATNYEYSKHINNRLRAFEIEIDMNQKRHGFRR